MATKPRAKLEADLVHPFIIHASVIGRIHTCLAFIAFLTALCVGCLCHYKKIVKNGVAGYPEEWFPSVSATYVMSSTISARSDLLIRIGDWYPERNLFQILIALTSGTLCCKLVFLA
jgi:hypothetical protein